MKLFLIVLLGCSLLAGCQQSGSIRASGSDDSIQLAEARRDEVTRLNHIDALSDNLIMFSCERESLCDTGTVIVLEDKDYMHMAHLGGTRDELVCTLNQVEFQQSIFSRIVVKTVRKDAMNVVTATTQFEVELPITTGIPANCELPPDTHGMR